MGGQALAGSRSGDTHKHAVRGVSLPDEVVELGVWAVLAVAFRHFRTRTVRRVTAWATCPKRPGKIAQRYMPGLIRFWTAQCAFAMRCATGAASPFLWDAMKVRSGLAAANQVASRPGQAAWPPGRRQSPRVSGVVHGQTPCALLGVSAETGGRARERVVGQP